MDPRNFAAYGEDLQKKLDSYNGSGFSASLMAEVLARYENNVSIDKDVVDAWDIPALHIQTKYTDNEVNMARDAVDTSIALAEAAGFEVLSKNYDPNPPGYSIHEIGTCRMGNNPKTSVLNKWCQSHDLKNLYIVDGASFVSSGWQNPTMTIVALAMRASRVPGRADAPGKCLRNTMNKSPAEKSTSCLRARLQPCRKCCALHAALAAEVPPTIHHEVLS